MADDLTKQRIAGALTRAYFGDPGDFVDVSDGDADHVHVVVVSRKFEGQHYAEKNDLLWSIIVRELRKDDWGKVTLSIGVSPTDIKASLS